MGGGSWVVRVGLRTCSCTRGTAELLPPTTDLLPPTSYRPPRTLKGCTPTCSMPTCSVLTYLPTYSLSSTYSVIGRISKGCSTCTPTSSMPTKMYDVINTCTPIKLDVGSEKNCRFRVRVIG